MALLTLKPVVVVANVDEDAAGKPLPEGMVPVAGALETEVAGMDPVEAAELLASFGLEERGLAGVIHADFQRGFIRAEVVTYDALVDAGSWNAARAKGLVRQEGKSYVMREGD